MTDHVHPRPSETRYVLRRVAALALAAAVLIAGANLIGLSDLPESGEPAAELGG